MFCLKDSSLLMELANFPIVVNIMEHFQVLGCREVRHG